MISLAAVWHARVMGIVAGVDGRRGGWALVLADVGAGLVVDVSVVPNQTPAGARELFGRCRDAGASVIGVDAPIGLPGYDWRPADLLAKRRLGRGSARVFLTAPREVLTEPTYALARARCRIAMRGKGLSAQAYGIRGPVLALDGALGGSAWARSHVVEVHPELSFMAMAARSPGDPMASKRTDLGASQRLAALERWLPDVRSLKLPPGDDHLDALAAAWSAHRWQQGKAEVLGGSLDATGLPMRMVI